MDGAFRLLFLYLLAFGFGFFVLGPIVTLLK